MYKRTPLDLVLKSCENEMGGIDGIVHFMLQGCLTLNNIARVTAERAEQELGVKNFYATNVHCQDMERFNEAEFEASIWDWLEMCLVEKEAKPKDQ